MTSKLKSLPIVVNYKNTTKSSEGDLSLEPYALYVHWPWCKKKCPYCDFNSHVNSDIPEEEYISYLLQQINHFSNFVGKRTLTSIFFGGGTPSLMAPKSVEKVILAAQQAFTFLPEIEITLEANPTSFEAKKFSDFIHAGVNRFSIGVQGLDPENLGFLGREHSATEAIQAVEKAMILCNNVNLDLIYGLPEQSLATWETQLTWAIGLKTKHLSAYQLTIEPNTAFYSIYKRGGFSMPSADSQADFYQTTTDILCQKGYEHYEISNYSLPGYASKHNLHVWNYRPYIGIGAGAHGRMKNKSNAYIATQGIKLPRDFMQSIQGGRQGLSVEELLTPDEMAVENLIMALRTNQGLDISAFEQRCGLPLRSCLNIPEYERLLTAGILKETTTHLYINHSYWSLLDNICNKIINNS